MNQEEITKCFHRLKFELACHKKKGNEFQNFFADIMEKHDKSFIRVIPYGNEGDMKCDGYSQDSATIYQCYAPNNIEKGKTISDAKTKIKEDFEGAKKLWFTDKSKWMKSWIFVWSGEPKGLPPQIIQVLQKIRDAQKEIAIDDWGLEKLWEIVESLSLSNKNDLLGVVPSSELVTEITAAEVSVLLEFLAKQESKEQTDDLDLLGISEKLEKNKFSLYMQGQIKICLPMTEFIDGYLSKHPDAEFQERIADVIVEKYKQFSENSSNSDEVIWQLIKYVQSPKENNEKYFFAATGIVAHYFHLCDIFEK